MIITKKELKEIIGMCLQARDGAAATPDPSSQDGNGQAEGQNPDAKSDESEADDIKALINECLDSRIQPLSAQLEKIDSIYASGKDSCERLRRFSDLFDEMVAHKNRSTLILTRYIEMYERIKNFQLFCEESFTVDESSPKEIRSVVQRVNNLERVSLKNLNSFGVVPIWPVRNDEFHDDEHQVIAETPVQAEGDQVGSIAECLKMGLRREGVVSRAAEVVLFKAAPETSIVEDISEPTVKQENQQGEN